MNNYEYILSCLPDISEDTRVLSCGANEIIGGILELLSDRDRKLADFFLKGFTEGALTAEFYRQAEKSSCRFIRDYYGFDLLVRNTKTAYLNRALGRPEDSDLVPAPDEDTDKSAQEAVRAVLAGKDILERERGLDRIMWEKIDELTALHIFDLTLILGFIARLKTVDRWMRLDENTGREMFGRFVSELRKSKNI